MKRFKSYLQEAKKPAWQESVSDRIFTKTLSLPISTTIYNRVFDSSPERDTVYHVMDVRGIESLWGLQGKKKSISAFTEMEFSVMRGGVNTGGGLVAEMEADILIEFPNDIMSRPDDNGRRWIPISNLKISTYEKVKKEIVMLMKSLMDKHFDTNFVFGNKPIDVLRAWTEVPARLMRHYVTIGEPQKRGRAKAMIIKEFIDGSEKIMKKSARQIKKELVQSQIKKRSADMWNELVVNKIDIKNLHIHRDRKFYLTFLNQFFSKNSVDMAGRLETDPTVVQDINRKMMTLAKKYKFQYTYHDKNSEFISAVKSKRASVVPQPKE